MEISSSDIIITDDNLNRAEKILNECFDEISDKTYDIISDYVTGEKYIDNLAFAIIYLPKERQEIVLNSFSDEMRAKLTKSMSRMSEKTKTSPEVIAETSKILKEADYFGDKISDEFSNKIPYSAQKAFFKKADEYFNKNPITAIALDMNLFNFENLLLLDDRGVQRLLREIDSNDLAKALKGANVEIQEKIFRNMSKRAAAMLQEDMEFMGPVRACDVEESQFKIINTLRRLENSGKIVICINNDSECIN